MEFWNFMFVPTILFMVVVAPIWITMHYRSVNRSSRSLSDEDRESIEQMLVTVDKLTDRIGAVRMSVVTYVIPVVSIVLGVVFRDETVSAWAIAGTVVVLTGAFLSSRVD